MKKIIYALILPMVVVSGLVFANHEVKNKPVKKSNPRPLSAAKREAAYKKWEATPDGIRYKEWKASPEGKKVLTDAAKIKKHIKDYTNMEGIVTSISLSPGSMLGFGIMVKINDEDYILIFGTEKSVGDFFNFNNEFKQLRNLKVNDKILIKSHSVSHAPKYSYPIVSGDYVEKDKKIVYERAPGTGGC